MRPEQHLRQQAAIALDATHAIHYRGPRTMAERNRLAAWLDGVERRPAAVEQIIRRLERLANHQAERRR